MPARNSQVDVALVSMPFGPLRQPSLGLGLLKAGLGDTSTRVFYFTIAFADRIGPALYDSISDHHPIDITLAGEWIFRDLLFPASGPSSDEYLDRFIRNGPGGDERAKDLLRVREQAEDFLQFCVAEVEKCRPRVVGFTSTFQQQIPSLALARRIKTLYPDTFIVFGGANCEGVMGREQLQQFPFLDAVVSGEADHVFPSVVSAVLAGKAPASPGVYLREKSNALATPHTETTPIVKSMDSLPFPDFDDFFDQWNSSAARSVFKARLLFETSRGCWWGEHQHCTFCGLNGSTMSFRSKSAGRALAELKDITRRHPGHPVMVVDNILDMTYFKDFVPELAKEQLRLGLFYEVKANLRKDQVRLLADAGIEDIQPGIENLTHSALRLMRKGVTPLQNIQLLKWCAEFGVRAHWSFIWGFPGEDPQEYDEVADMIPLLAHLRPPIFASKIRLDRFSPNFFEAEARGICDVTPYPAYSYIYPFPPEAVTNLAYYFEFKYREHHDVGAYTKRLVEEIAGWRKSYGESELFFVNKGDELWIWDLRPSARKSLHVLSELEGQLYLGCDAVRTIHSLALESSLPIAEVEPAIDRFMENGLMVRSGDQVLALALPSV